MNIQSPVQLILGISFIFLKSLLFLLFFTPMYLPELDSSCPCAKNTTQYFMSGPCTLSNFTYQMKTNCYRYMINFNLSWSGIFHKITLNILQYWNGEWRKRKNKVLTSMCGFLLKKSINSDINFKVQCKFTDKIFYSHVSVHHKHTIVIKS